MSTDVAVRENGQQQTVLSNEQLQYIAKTEFVPPGLRGNLPAILACVATGRALGIADMTALRSIHIIDGKATFSAELMVQLVRRQGHSITGEVTDGAATVSGRRADNGDTMTMTWTLAMADRAGLLGKSNWKKYPESMLWARASSQLCRMLFADCFAGATYTPEELDETEMLSAEDPPQLALEPVADDGLFPPIEDVAVDAEPVIDRSKLTAPQAKNLNRLVGTLRDAGHLTTEHLYKAVDPEGADNWPRDEDGVLHWAPLRDGLNRDQATALIDRLTRLEEKVAAGGFQVPVGARAATEQAEAT